MPTPKVFISHASADAKNAEGLVKAIESRGMPCWVAPRDIPAGSDFASAIYDGLDACVGVIALLSRSANASEHVARELGIAVQLSKRIVPLSLDNTKTTGALCYYTRVLQVGNLADLHPQRMESLHNVLVHAFTLQSPPTEA